MEELRSLPSLPNQGLRLLLQQIQPEVTTPLLDGLAMKLSLMPTHFHQPCHLQALPSMQNGPALRL